MSRIDSIYWFDYTNEIGFYDSIRNFTHLEMKYISLALSTEKVRVNSTPTEFKISAEGSEKIREYVISYMGELKEISKELAINSPMYILITYADDSKKYFRYDTDFCDIFTIAKNYKVAEKVTVSKVENPYIIQSEYTVETINSKKPTYEQLTTSLNSKVSTSVVYGKGKKEEKKNNSVIKAWLGIFFVCGIVAMISVMVASKFGNAEDSSASYSENSGTSFSDYTEEVLSPIAEPMSGEILAGSEVYDGSELMISASGGESCVVKLKTSSGVTRLSFYVRAGETVTVGVPAEYMYVYFASGDTWYGTTELFGEDTSYSMDDDLLDFTQYTWEYTLYPVSNGNFSETLIDASEF